MNGSIICRLIPILLTLGFSSCDKTEYPTYYMGPDFTEYVLFPQGSYWVYNQAGNTRVDSIYLYRQATGINEAGRIYPFNYEGFRQNLSSSYYRDTLFGGGGADSYGDLIFFDYTEGYISNSQEVNLQFYTGHKIGTTLEWTESESVKYVDSLGPYTVNGQQYKDVKVFESTILRSSLMTKKIYYARGVGVIRKELFNGQVWNLLRYKVD